MGTADFSVTTVTQKKSQRGPCDLFVPGPMRYEAYRRIRGAGSGARESAYHHWYPQGRRRGDRQGRGLAERCRLPRHHFATEIALASICFGVASKGYGPCVRTILGSGSCLPLEMCSRADYGLVVRAGEEQGARMTEKLSQLQMPSCHAGKPPWSSCAGTLKENG